MTDVLDGPAEPGAASVVAPSDPEAERPEAADGAAPDGSAATASSRPPEARGGRLDLSPPLRSLMAALSGAAGVIHLAMVPSHIDEWAAEGVAFALVGWGQIALALLILGRPSRGLLRIVAGLNLLAVGAWVVTRTTGAPFGPHSGHAESASLVDVTTVGLEVALILLAAVVLLRPATGSLALPGGGGPLAVGIAPVLVLALTTGVLASPSARNHAHDTHDGHGEGAEMAGGGHHGAAGGGHGGGDRALAPILQEDDRGLSDLRNGHHHEIVERELDAATQADLDEQLALTREVAAEYPTLADALAAGYRRIGPYFPGIGAHYRTPNPEGMNRDGVMDREALLNPFVIVYDGFEPSSRVAGFMYLTMSEGEPEGFAGPNDVWHNHQNLCLKDMPNGEIDVPFGLDHAATEEQCAAAGGDILPISPWMVHVWSAPGYDDDPDVGTFHEVHTDLTCEDGSYHMLPPEEWVDHQRNVCRAGAA